MLTLLIINLVVMRWGAQVWLGWLNRRHVEKHSGTVPDAFVEVIDQPTYAKSVAYTLAKHRFAQVEYTWDMVLLLALLFSGVLPWSYTSFLDGLGGSAWSMAAYVFAVGIGLSALSLPLDWYAQFHLEERFGFNTTTARTWWTDRVKGFL